MNLPMTIPHYLQRMIDEEKELATKVEKIEQFRASMFFAKNLTLAEQALINAQAMFMAGYFSLLRERIKLAFAGATR